jgi:hypothetical protein
MRLRDIACQSISKWHENLLNNVAIQIFCINSTKFCRIWFAPKFFVYIFDKIFWNFMVFWKLNNESLLLKLSTWVMFGIRRKHWFTQQCGTEDLAGRQHNVLVSRFLEDAFHDFDFTLFFCRLVVIFRKNLNYSK